METPPPPLFLMAALLAEWASYEILSSVPVNWMSIFFGIFFLY